MLRLVIERIIIPRSAVFPLPPPAPPLCVVVLFNLDYELLRGASLRAVVTADRTLRLHLHAISILDVALLHVYIQN